MYYTTETGNQECSEYKLQDNVHRSLREDIIIVPLLNDGELLVGSRWMSKTGLRTALERRCKTELTATRIQQPVLVEHHASVARSTAL